MLMVSIKKIRIAFSLVITLTILTGIIYPLIVTEIAQVFFPWKANGSLLLDNKKIIGSKLIGQSFSDKKYFWGRPSATANYPYNAADSSGSNTAIANPDYIKILKTRISNLQKTSDNHLAVPIDLITASGSGLDPQISPAAAYYQVARIANARHIPQEKLIELINN